MGSVFNFELLHSGLISDQVLQLGITDFESLCNYIRDLPYGRNTDKMELSSIIHENQGTCSTKHAFLKTVATEQHRDEVELYLGIYEMSEKNTAGVGKVLFDNGLRYIPEAHVYLRYQDRIHDYTRANESKQSFAESLIFEQCIQPDQIGVYKEQLHKTFISNWILKNDIDHDANRIWEIREDCISALG